MGMTGTWEWPKGCARDILYWFKSFLRSCLTLALRFWNQFYARVSECPRAATRGILALILSSGTPSRVANSFFTLVLGLCWARKCCSRMSCWSLVRRGLTSLPGCFGAGGAVDGAAPLESMLARSATIQLKRLGTAFAATTLECCEGGRGGGAFV